jgi:hypothetical protein
VNNNLVGRGLHEAVEQAVWLLNHQVDVQGQLGGLTNSVNHYLTKGNSRDKVTIHHVHMNQLGPGFRSVPHLLAQHGKVGGQH